MRSNLKLREDQRRILGPAGIAFAANKVVVILTSLVATRDIWRGQPFWRALYVVFVRGFDHYDAEWYTGIAAQGYSQPKATAFFPFYPLVMRAMSSALGISALAAGVLVSNALLFLLFYFFVSLALEDYDRRLAFRAALLLALFPTAFYFSAPYTETLFMLLSVLALRALRRRLWPVAGGFGGLAALTRNTGVLLALPFLIELWGARKAKARVPRPRRWPATFRQLPWVTLICAGPALYAGYLWVAFRDPLLFIRVQNLFNRRFLMPWTTLYEGYAAGLRSLWHAYWPPDASQLYHATEMLFPLLVLVVLVVSFRKLRWSYWVMLLYSAIIPLLAPLAATPGTTGESDYFMSFSRYSLAVVPLYFGLVLLLRGRRSFWIFLAVSTILLVVLTYMSVSGAWVA